jgi:hypothetical protein
LERYAPLFEMPEPSYERFLRRRDRKRRNQRIAAGVVGMALFVTAVLVVAAAGPPDRSQTPASTGPTIFGPTATGPTALPGVPVGSVGLPPEGATPSTPERGSLVLSSVFGHTPGDPGRVELYLYEDGRLITRQLAGGGIERTTGFLEQRLTPEGVELLRSEALSTGLFDRDLGLAAPGLHSGEIQVLDGDRLVRVAWGDQEDPVTAATPEQRSALERLDARLQDPASWLPASAWEDQTLTPYVAARYRVCYEANEAAGLDEVLAALPGPAADVLRSLDRRHGEYAPLVRRHGVPVYSDGPAVDFWCSALKTEQALALTGILDDADVPSNGGDIFGIAYHTRDRQPVRVEINFMPMLPHE